jgi:hypothetical protein
VALLATMTVSDSWDQACARDLGCPRLADPHTGILQVVPQDLVCGFPSFFAGGGGGGGTGV